MHRFLAGSFSWAGKAKTGLTPDVISPFTPEVNNHRLPQPIWEMMSYSPVMVVSRLGYLSNTHFWKTQYWAILSTVRNLIR